MLGLILIFTLNFGVMAEEKPTATAWTKGSVRSLKRLFSPKSNVRILSREEEDKLLKQSKFVDGAERDGLFRKAGIERKVASMDEFDKDMLILNARHAPLSALKSTYPTLTEKQLRILRTELGKRK